MGKIELHVWVYMCVVTDSYLWNFQLDAGPETLLELGRAEEAECADLWERE